MSIRRVLAVAALAAGMLPAVGGVASAHLLSVATPSGQTNTQVLHSGNTSLPPHTGAFKLHVTCNVNPANPAITVLGPNACG